MAAPNLWVNLGLRSAAFDAGIDKSKRKIRGFGTDTEKLSRMLIALGRTAVLAAGARGVGALAGSFVRAASMAEEVGSKFDVVFRNLAGSTRQWAVDFGDSVGRATVDVERWLAGLQDTFVPLGIAREESARLAKSLVQLAVDVGSFNNAVDDEVIRDFTSALVGNHETVRKYGIIISQSAMQQEAYTLGLNKSYSALTDLEKVQIRYSLIQKGTSDAQGDAIRTADSFANSVKALSANWTEFKVNLGKLVTPPLAELIGDLNRVDRYLKDLSSSSEQIDANQAATNRQQNMYNDWVAGVDTSRQIPPGMVPGPRPGTFMDPADERVYDLGTPMGETGITPLGRQRLAEQRARIRELHDLEQAGIRAVKGYTGMLPGTEFSLERTVAQEGGKVIEEVDYTVSEIDRRFQMLGYSMGHSFGAAADRMIWESERASDAINSILRDMTRNAMQMWIFSPLGDMLGTGMTKLFKTNPAGSKGEVPVKSAAGNIFTGPSLTTAGEAGPEAVVPLTRGPGGQLGIQASGAAPVNNIVQIINRTGTPMVARAGQSQRSGRDLMTQVFVDDWERGGPVRQVMQG